MLYIYFDKHLTVLHECQQKESGNRDEWEENIQWLPPQWTLSSDLFFLDKEYLNVIYYLTGTQGAVSFPHSWWNVLWMCVLQCEESEWKRIALLQCCVRYAFATWCKYECFLLHDISLWISPVELSSVLVVKWLTASGDTTWTNMVHVSLCRPFSQLAF